VTNDDGVQGSVNGGAARKPGYLPGSSAARRVGERPTALRFAVGDTAIARNDHSCSM
jgi:hypothetical protein